MRRALLFLVLVVTARAGDPPPNIVLVISDDQAWTDYGFMGHDTIETPHLDALAKESVVFRRGYVPTSLCRPSLATLATGHFAHRHGITGNDPSPRGIRRGSDIYRKRRADLIAKIDRLETLPKRLAKRGYLSHQSGKWWEGSFARGGFTHGMTRGFPQKGGRHGDDGLTIGRKGLAPIDGFIRSAVAKKKPFFVWYAPFLPHTPHNPPARLVDPYRRSAVSPHVFRYQAMCTWFDETCGALLGLLDTHGVRENTLVVYVTDNGWVQRTDRGGFAPRSKQTPYEGGVRTPVLFRWPARVKPADRPELVSSIDLVPTILAAAGAPPIEGLPGLDLMPHLEKGTPIARDAVFGEGFAHDVAELDDPEASLLYRWIIEGRWKLILSYDGATHRHARAHAGREMRPHLFDLEADPHEKVNLASRHSDVVARLAKRIGAWYPVKKRRVRVKWE